MQLISWSTLSLVARDLALPLFTGVIGYVISQCQANRTFIRDRNKALNTALYSLLEMKWEVQCSNPGQAMRLLRLIMRDRLGDAALDFLAVPANRRFLFEALTTVLTSDRGALSKRHAEAVQSLVPFCPTLAYQLASAEIVSLDEKVKSYLLDAKKFAEVGDNSPDGRSFADLEEQLLDEMIGQAVSKLTDDLNAIVLYYPWYKRRHLRRIVTEQSRRGSAEAIQQFVSEFCGRLVAGQAAT